MIFECLFRSTVISHGLDKAGSNHTAILSTCKLFHQEAESLLGSIVSYHFRSTEVMLDCLFTLSPHQLREIRNIRVEAFPLSLIEDKDDYPSTTHYFCAALCVLTGLCLDCLVVEDCYSCFDNDWAHRGAYNEIAQLLCADGWKELHFIVPSAHFLLLHVNRDAPQPAKWNELPQRRDGKDSGASVAMYQAKDFDAVGATGHPDTRTSFNSDLARSAPPEERAVTEDKDVPTPDGIQCCAVFKSREVLVVAKRGKNAAIRVQHSDGWPTIFRALLGRMTWQEIKENGHYDNHEDCPVDIL